MIRTQRMALAGMALLAAVSAAPGRALAQDNFGATTQDGVVAPAMTQAEQAQQQEMAQAAADCERDGGWFDRAAEICDPNGVK